MGIAENILHLRATLPGHVTLVAVSKNRPAGDILEAYQAGQRDFGENRVQEMLSKAPQLPSDIRWHLIGHLQTNKVKSMLPLVHLVHSVDSYRLLKEIDRESAKLNRVTACLLQFHIASEESKFGFNLEEALQMLEDTEYHCLHNVTVRGVMGMATFTDNQHVVRHEFRELLRIFTFLKDEYFVSSSEFFEVSMGMSGDYELAVEEGSTLVRIGTSIFGERIK